MGRNLIALLGAVALSGFLSAAVQAQVVALGASNTAGKGVAPQEAYPAQLEAMLRAKGYNGHVVNAGLNGDTTAGMLARLDSAVPNGTRVVILQPGGNDFRRRGAARRRAPRTSSRSCPGYAAAGFRSSCWRTRR